MEVARSVIHDIATMQANLNLEAVIEVAAEADMAARGWERRRPSL